MIIIILLIAIHLAISVYAFVLGRKVQASNDKVIIDRFVSANKKHTLQSENFRSELGTMSTEYSELLERYAVLCKKYYTAHPCWNKDDLDEDALATFEVLQDFKSEAKDLGLTLEEFLTLRYKPKKFL